MGSIPLPALGIRPPEQQDPLSGIKSALAIKGAQQQQQLQQQQIQGKGLENQLAQQQVKDQQTVMQVLGAHQGDVNAALPDLAGKVSPQTFISLQKSNLDTRKTLAEIDDKELATKKDQNDRLAQLVSQASSLPPDQYAQQWPSIAQAALGINPKLSDHINPNQPMPQQALQSVGLGLQTQEQYYKQEEDKRAAAKQAAEMPGLLADAQKKQKENAGTGPTGITAEQLITNKQKQAEVGISAGHLKEDIRHNQAQEGGPVSLVPPGITGEEALKLMDPQRAAAVKMIGDGKVDFATMTSRMPPGAKFALANDVHSYNPDFNQATFGIEKKVEQKFTSGNVSDQLMAIGTAREHMKTFSALADALDNGNVQALNKIGNAIGVQFGSDKATNLKIAAQAFGGEVGKAFDGSGVTAEERKSAGASLSDALSKGQFRGAIQTVDELLAGKQRAAKKAYDTARQGKPNFGDQPETSSPSSSSDPFAAFEGKARGSH